MITNRISNQFGTVVPPRRRTASIHLVQSSRFARRLAKMLIVGLFLSILMIGIFPWQQTSRGTGRVVALKPQEREQAVKARTKGVVVKIREGLQDGVAVKKDEVLMEIQPFASNMIQQLNNQLTEVRLKESGYLAKADVFQRNIDVFTEAREFTLSSSQEMVEMAKSKLESKQKLVAAYEAKKRQAKLNYDRQEGLLRKGIKAAKEVEKLLKDLEVADAELESAHREVDAARSEVKAKEQKLKKEVSLAQTKVDNAKAYLEDANLNAANARKEIGDLQMKLGQMDGNVIKAPRDGTVLRLNVNELGATVKEGDPLLIIIPDAKEKAVELFVNGNDMPLVQVDQEVRLQFEGWPAVQFAGWPSVAVGTFSGRVATVDPTDNGKGEFRILITPNEKDQEWPSDRYLRQGVRANGWVMLREVSLGYEIWRQLNGFPVIVAEKEPSKDKAKPPKLPK